MTNETILTEVLLKASTNGHWLDRSAIFSFIYNWKNSCAPIEPLIFSHEFAKAFWGTESQLTRTRYLYEHRDFKLRKEIFIQDWQYHLQQMVLEKEPLKYLEKFL